MRIVLISTLMFLASASGASAAMSDPAAKPQAAPAAPAAAKKPALPLEAYVGTFGPAKVVLEKGELIVNAPEGPRKLVSLGANLFEVAGEGGIKADFQIEGGTAKAIEVVRANGSRFRQERTD